MIINIESSPLKKRRFRIYFLDATYIDIGSSKRLDEYIDTGNKHDRRNYYKHMDKTDKHEFILMRPCRVVLEACLLNGPTTNVITNINYANETLFDFI
jgi:hypothetical protein